MAKTIYREVSAPTLLEGMIHIMELTKGLCDVYLVDWEADEIEGRVKITVYGWENNKTREALSV
jgi:hypothetical protein